MTDGADSTATSLRRLGSDHDVRAGRGAPDLGVPRLRAVRPAPEVVVPGMDLKRIGLYAALATHVLAVAAFIALFATGAEARVIIASAMAIAASVVWMVWIRGLELNDQIKAEAQMRQATGQNARPTARYYQDDDQED